MKKEYYIVVNGVRTGFWSDEYIEQAERKKHPNQEDIEIARHNRNYAFEKYFRDNDYASAIIKTESEGGY